MLHKPLRGQAWPSRGSVTGGRRDGGRAAGGLHLRPRRPARRGGSGASRPRGARGGRGRAARAGGPPEPSPPMGPRRRRAGGRRRPARGARPHREIALVDRAGQTGRSAPVGPVRVARRRARHAPRPAARRDRDVLVPRRLRARDQVFCSRIAGTLVAWTRTVTARRAASCPSATRPCSWSWAARPASRRRVERGRSRRRSTRSRGDAPGSACPGRGGDERPRAVRPRAPSTAESRIASWPHSRRVGHDADARPAAQVVRDPRAAGPLRRRGRPRPRVRGRGARPAPRPTSWSATPPTTYEVLFLGFAPGLRVPRSRSGAARRAAPRDAPAPRAGRQRRDRRADDGRLSGRRPAAGGSSAGPMRAVRSCPPRRRPASDPATASGSCRADMDGRPRPRGHRRRPAPVGPGSAVGRARRARVSRGVAPWTATRSPSRTRSSATGRTPRRSRRPSSGRRCGRSPRSRSGSPGR